MTIERLTMSTRPIEQFVLAREFQASRDRLWQAWTQRDQFMHWWGPQGFTTTKCTFDLRPGGFCHYKLDDGQGNSLWGKATYTTIDEPQRLEFIVTFSNEDGEMTDHPWEPNWPRQMMSTVTFDEHNGKTRVTVTWLPMSPTDAELETFNDSHDKMEMGWSGTFDKLAAYLAGE